MKMVNIRSVRGENLKRSAEAGELVGVMKTRRLIGVMIPVTPNWVAHVIESNWSRVLQSVTEGESAMAGGGRMATLEDALLGGGEQPPVGQPAGRTLPRMLASVGVLDTEDSEMPPTQSVRVGDLSAAVVERAAAGGELLAVTHSGELLGIIVPVTERLVGYLINKNASRVHYNVGLGEKEAMTGEPWRTIEKALTDHPDVVAPDAPAKS